MAYNYDFKDDIIYGADDINAIRASILTKGVVDESSDSCRVVLCENGVKVLQGQAVFEDGCRIKIDSDGVNLDITAGAVNYVYLKNNTLAGICEVLCSTEAPAGDFVLLAIVDEQGTVCDERQFAQLKTADVERYAESFATTFAMRDNMKEGDVISEIILPKSNCSMIEFTLAFSTDVNILIKLFPKEDNKIMWNYWKSGDCGMGDSMKIFAFSQYRTIRFEVSGNILSVIFVSSTSTASAERTIGITGVCIR